MATKRRTGSPAAKAPSKSAAKKSGARRKAATKLPAAKDARDFVRGVLARGEAAKPSKKGELPPGVTHEIVGVTKDGHPKLRRRRFSLV
jgi:hypothetical protein